MGAFNRNCCCGSGALTCLLQDDISGVSYDFAGKWEQTTGSWAYSSASGGYIATTDANARLTSLQESPTGERYYRVTYNFSFSGGSPASGTVVRIGSNVTASGGLVIEWAFDDPTVLRVYKDGSEIMASYRATSATPSSLFSAFGVQEGGNGQRKSMSTAPVIYTSAGFGPDPSGVANSQETWIEIEGLPGGVEFRITSFTIQNIAPSQVNLPTFYQGDGDFLRQNIGTYDYFVAEPPVWPRAYGWSGFVDPDTFYPIAEVAYGPGFPHRDAASAELYDQPCDDWHVNYDGITTFETFLEPLAAGQSLISNKSSRVAVRLRNREQLDGQANGSRLAALLSMPENTVMRFSVNRIDSSNYVFADVTRTATGADVVLGERKGGAETEIAADSLTFSGAIYVALASYKYAVTAYGANAKVALLVSTTTGGAGEVELAGPRTLALTANDINDASVECTARTTDGDGFGPRLYWLVTGPSRVYCPLLEPNLNYGLPTVGGRAGSLFQHAALNLEVEVVTGSWTTGNRPATTSEPAEILHTVPRDEHPETNHNFVMTAGKIADALFAGTLNDNDFVDWKFGIDGSNYWAVRVLKTTISGSLYTRLSLIRNGSVVDGPHDNTAESFGAFVIVRDNVIYYGFDNPPIYYMMPGGWYKYTAPTDATFPKKFGCSTTAWTGTLSAELWVAKLWDWDHDAGAVSRKELNWQYDIEGDSELHSVSAPSVSVSLPDPVTKTLDAARTGSTGHWHGDPTGLFSAFRIQLNVLAGPLDAGLALDIPDDQVVAHDDCDGWFGDLWLVLLRDKPPSQYYYGLIPDSEFFQHAADYWRSSQRGDATIFGENTRWQPAATGVDMDALSSVAITGPDGTAYVSSI